jgi:hypothetical protein
LARIAKPGGVGGGWIDIAHHELLAELRAPGNQLAVLVHDEAVPVENQLVLAADEVAEGDVGEIVPSPLHEHPLPLDALSAVIGRGGDVHDHLRARERLVAGRGARLPDVLADREADRRAVDADHRRHVAHLEVAVLVEHTVVGEKHLAVDRLHAPVGQHRKRVVDVLGMLGEPDQGHHAAHVTGHVLQRPPPGRQEMGLEQQVLGRVAVDCQLWKHRHLRARVGPQGKVLADLGRISLHVADRGVDLRQREAQRPVDWGHDPILGFDPAVPGPARPAEARV